MTRTALLASDVAEIVRAEDVELSSLSDEQFEALWADERLSLDPESEPSILAAVRSLVAAGLARLDPDGDIVLVGDAALIKRCRSAIVPTAVVRWGSEAEAPRTWLLVERDIVLEHTWEQPGVHRFALRRLRHAVDDLVSQVVPAEARASSPGSTGAAEALVERLKRSAGTVARIDVLLPDDVSTDGPSAGTFGSLTVATAGAGECVMLTPEGEHMAVSTVSRASMRKLLVSLLQGRNPSG